MSRFEREVRFLGVGITYSGPYRKDGQIEGPKIPHNPLISSRIIASSNYVRFTLEFKR